MGKKQPIINHGLLRDTINYAALMEAQASMPAFEGAKREDKPKVKTLGTKGKTPYTRMQHK